MRETRAWKRYTELTSEQLLSMSLQDTYFVAEMNALN